MDTQRKTVMDEVVHLIRVSILTDSQQLEKLFYKYRLGLNEKA